MLLVAALAAASFVALAVAIAYQRHRAGKHPEREAVVLFETRADQPYRRPVFTARSTTLLHLEAPVVHARLATDILFLDIRSEAGGEQVGFELAVANFPHEWLTSERYAYLEPEAQLLIGPRGASTERLLRRVGQRHDLDLPASAGKHVHAYEIASVLLDPAEDTIRFDAILPDGGVLKVSYDYVRASITANVPVTAFDTAENAQPLGIRIAA